MLSKYDESNYMPAKAIFAGFGTVFALISTALLVYVFKEKRRNLPPIA